MLFNSLPFLYGFLPVTYFVFWRLKDKKARFLWLTVTGYVFYGFWNWKFCGLMALSTVVSYLAGRGLLAWSAPGRRRLCLVLPVAFDLALLGFFKYAGFTVRSIGRLVEATGHEWLFTVPNIILPVGISFYTFHTITYIVDSYRRTITPTRSFFEFSCYVSLFAQLVAGPIVRFRQIEKDLENLDHADSVRSLDVAWSFFVIGLVKKVVVADTLARLINPGFSSVSHLSTLGAWEHILGYSYQLYFDFSGYSDMAVGLGLMFGLRLPQNFNSPYKAIDIADFWRRWHISLSTVLRDYLYIPLGGNRCGRMRTNVNLMVTMLLGGLWHGASWTYVTWGGLHGGLLLVNRYAGRSLLRLPAGVRRAGTFLAVVIGWVFFRCATIAESWMFIRRMFLWTPGHGESWTLLAVVVVAGAVGHLAPNTFEMKHRWGAGGTVLLGIGFVACLILIATGVKSPFLYFQF